MSHTAAKKRYKTTNWAQYNASLKARGSLTIWLGKRMTWFAAASGKRGRSPKFSDAAIQFCLTLKNLFGLGTAPGNRFGRVCIAAIRFELTNARLQHLVQTPADA